MTRRRNVALVSGVVFVTVVVVAIVVSLFWRAQAGRLDDMSDAVTSFDAPDEWAGWTLVAVTSRGYSPICIDVACPSYSERYVTAVPVGDVGRVLEVAIEEMDIGPVTAPARQCVAGERCLYTVDGDGFTIDVVLASPFEFEQGTVPSIPEGFVEVAITLNAY